MNIEHNGRTVFWYYWPLYGALLCVFTILAFGVKLLEIMMSAMEEGE
jgi:hypothetical protein